MPKKNLYINTRKRFHRANTFLLNVEESTMTSNTRISRVFILALLIALSRANCADSSAGRQPTIVPQIERASHTTELKNGFDNLLAALSQSTSDGKAEINNVGERLHSSYMTVKTEVAVKSLEIINALKNLRSTTIGYIFGLNRNFLNVIGKLRQYLMGHLEEQHRKIGGNVEEILKLIKDFSSSFLNNGIDFVDNFKSIIGYLRDIVAGIDTKNPDDTLLGAMVKNIWTAVNSMVDAIIKLDNRIPTIESNTESIKKLMTDSFAALNKKVDEYGKMINKIAAQTDRIEDVKLQQSTGAYPVNDNQVPFSGTIKTPELDLPTE